MGHGLTGRLSALFLLSAFLALPASATVYSVTTTQGYANALSAAVPGDDIQLADGTYGDVSGLTPVPSVYPTTALYFNGPFSNGTSSARIRIIGNTGNNSKVHLYGMPGTLDQGAGASYITWHSVTFDNQFSIGREPRFSNGGSVGDSIVKCRMLKSTGLNNTTFAVLNTDTLGSNANDASFALTNIATPAHCTDNTVVDCVMYIRKTNPDDGKSWKVQGLAGPASTIFRTTFTRCQINSRMLGTPTLNGVGFGFYYTNQISMTDCRFTVIDSISANNANSNYVLIANLWRDGDRNWTCLRDTFEVLKGAGMAQAGLLVRNDLTSPGNEGTSAGHRKFTNCIFRNTCTNAGERGAFDWNNGICADTLSHCQFLASDPTRACVGIYDIRAENNDLFGRTEGVSFFDHCTFIGGIGNSYSGTANTGLLQVKRISIIPDAADLWIRNCIFLAVDSTGGNPYVGFQKAGIYVDMEGGYAAHYHRDWNLYAYKGKTTTLGDRAIQYRMAGQPSVVVGHPETSPAPWSAGGTSGAWYTASGQLPASAGPLDGNSKWGYAMFFGDDSSAATTTGAIKSTSAAALADEFGKDMGAVPQSTDVTAPSALVISVRTAGSEAVALTWTATGDDAGVGTAKSYQIRYSTSLITSGNFGTATDFPSPILPSVAGTTEVATVRGLTSGTDYYFAVKAIDEAGNAGVISNIIFQSTGASGGHLLKIPN